MDEDHIHSFVGHEEIRRFFDELRGTDVTFIGHNIVSYDGPHTTRLVDGFATIDRVVDTLVLSYLYDPVMVGGHSLEAWGERLREPKGNFSDWSAYSMEMDQYCQQDVRLGKKVFKALVTRMRRMGFSELSCEIEHHIREVVDEQQRNGWYFDIPGAQSLLAQLRAEQCDLEVPIRDLFPRRLQVAGTYRRRTRKDGSEFASFSRHLSEYPELRFNGDGTYSTLDWQEFNIGSPKQRVERLLELGWQPEAFTPKGFPKVDEDSLVAYASLSGKPEVAAIADWLVLQGRASMVEGWLNNVDYDDHCMHGRVFTCGASTRRMTHNSPNTANIPKAKKSVKYGVECRRLWQARPGRREVGYDASGLELRMFAEYLNDPVATKLYTEGDPHMFNTELLEWPREYRDTKSKTIIYAMLYGAQNTKLGITEDPSYSTSKAKERGAWIRNRLEKGIPGFGRLTHEVQDEFKSTGGFLRTIDGGFVRCPTAHAALNYKLQSAGAIVMKKAAIIARQTIRERGLDSLLVGSIHDEGQHDAKSEDSEIVGQTCVRAIEQAGLELGFRVPLTGEYKVGANWAECH